MALQVLRWLFTLAKDTQPEAKVVVGAAGSFHSDFSLCKHILPCTTLNKGWWTGRLFEWMTDMPYFWTWQLINNIRQA